MPSLSDLAKNGSGLEAQCEGIAPSRITLRFFANGAYSAPKKAREQGTVPAVTATFDQKESVIRSIPAAPRIALGRAGSGDAFSYVTGLSVGAHVSSGVAAFAHICARLLRSRLFAIHSR